MFRRALIVAALAGGWAITVAASPSPAPAATPAPSPAASATPAPSPSPQASPSPSPTPSPSPSPSPSPPPSSGELNLSPTSGPSGTTITVTGSRFRPNEAITVFWDTKEHSLGGASADAGGSFKGDFKAPDDVAGAHVICALEPNQVCASFQLSPKQSPSPTASASPPPPPAVSSPAAGGASGDSGLPTSSRPVGMLSLLVQTPFVIFPILVVLALLGLAIWWIRSGSEPGPVVSSATVRHRASPPAAAPARQAEAPLAETPPPAPPEPEPPAPPPGRPRPLDEPPDLPTPGD